MGKVSYVPNGAKIKVIGLGGAGCNAITRMVREQIRGVEFIAMNTDAQHLAITEAPTRIQLGERCTRGLGAGGNNKKGEEAAEESLSQIKQVVEGADMVFITAGMGGGTGTGSAPVVARASKETGALTIGVVTKPFGFEGARRAQVAEEGIESLVDNVDTMIIVPNERLFSICDAKCGMDGAFKLVDETLCHGVQAIAEVITVPGTINLDFADVKAVMKGAGPAWMSIGKGSGKNRAVMAAENALSSPLLDVSVNGAMGVIFNISGSDNLTLYEVNEAAEIIRQQVDPNANVIFGVTNDPRQDSEVRLTLIATGFASNRTTSAQSRDIEINRVLKNIRTEAELEVPSFQRLGGFLNNRRTPQYVSSNRR
ncbi:MAG: cell division protein FtsZ [Dehalococcoidales bacterium]|nr:cell division protein FtsZ [Dehalococcoidales bacterium]MDD3264575.1 cell division protein FtsZ [Dehalococcoidales bacterium]MDD4322217.1 cell division protein FtsZ [Dehalococcoidales bacterium]MDD4794243.1 cell division protein FtsZ [Dehalococcoidales bacterium]MDD5497943.1 cell division protein FtsZ [Dehalococcoidales bacterium]